MGKVNRATVEKFIQFIDGFDGRKRAKLFHHEVDFEDYNAPEKYMFSMSFGSGSPNKFENLEDFDVQWPFEGSPEFCNFKGDARSYLANCVSVEYLVRPSKKLVKLFEEVAPGWLDKTIARLDRVLKEVVKKKGAKFKRASLKKIKIALEKELVLNLGVTKSDLSRMVDEFWAGKLLSS